ncbi:MAG: response regulator [Aestuariibacter sp.]
MRILLIEDDSVIADLIVKGMKESGFVIEHASDGISGLNLALSSGYDLAIIDIMLPKLNGLSIIDQIRERRIKMPIIILSAKRDVDDRINGLRHGSDDYLTKPFSFSELLARVEALIRRANNVTEPTSLEYADIRLDLLSRTVTRRGINIVLQPKEFALLEYLIRSAERVVSKTMIMERVWNYHFDPNTNVVEARVSKLRDKIDRDFDEQLIHTVRGLGYVLKR